MLEKRVDELAPCGVFCGACPSFGKSCLGCSSENPQKRTSKWNCKIRTCCYIEQKLTYCIRCGRFPCDKINRKLIFSHPKDSRFAYRHEIPKVFPRLGKMGERAYLNFQRKRYTCTCGGTVHFYDYTCVSCGKKHSTS